MRNLGACAAVHSTMSNDRARLIVFRVLTFAGLSLAACGQQPAVNSTNAPTQPGIPHFEFDRKPEPVIFRDGDVQLSGVLVKPDGTGPFPAVVFVHGAGPATHDEIAFVIHANAFLRQGFAVLSYDKRGSGASGGNLELSDYDDLARDVLAGVSYLRTRTEITKSKIGLLGRSEGGWVGTIAASRDPQIAFVIMSSGSAVSPYDETLYWTRTGLRAKGLPDAQIEKALKLKISLWEFYRDVADGKLTKPEQHKILVSLQPQFAEFASFRPEMPSGIMDPEVEPRQKFGAFTHMMYYDPAPTLSGLRAPLLEIIGAKDEVVEPDSTVAALKRVSASGHDVNVTVLPNVGHSLLVMDGERIMGYPSGYPDDVVSWARERVQRLP
jgi:uncharacterized protein